MEEEAVGKAITNSQITNYNARDSRVLLLLLKSTGICRYLPCEASGSVGTLLRMDLASMSPH